MSLDILGKLLCPPSDQGRLTRALERAARAAHVHVVTGQVDPADHEVFNEVPELRGPGVDYCVWSDERSGSAEELWGEAMLAVREVTALSVAHVRRLKAEDLPWISFPAAYYQVAATTRLGLFLAALMGSRDCRGGCVAIVDGGVEEFYTAAPSMCLRHIMTTMVLPWDCLPNNLYVWRHDADAETSGGGTALFGEAGRQAISLRAEDEQRPEEPEMNEVRRAQRKLCRHLGVPWVEAPEHMKLGISRNARTGVQPLNGLRHPPEGDTTGWYIWAGEDLSQDPGFFLPLHVLHLQEWCPAARRYLGLPPGWRFQINGEREDLWYDPSLLEI